MAELIHNLPIPDLDDKTFEELVEEARTRIPLYAPGWTDHNLSDPGITLIDLFAWLAEMQIYSLNLLPDKNYLKFLKLLNEKPRPGAPAKVDVTFTASQNVTIDANTPLVAQEGATGKEIVFETDADVEFLPINLNKIVSLADLKYTDHTDANNRVGVFYHAFGEEAAERSILYLGFEGLLLFSVNSEFQSDLDGDSISEALRQEFEKNRISLSQNVTILIEEAGRRWFITDDDNQQRYIVRKEEDKLNIHVELGRFAGKEMTVTIYLYEADLPSKGAHGDEKLQITLSPQLTWEYRQKTQDGTQWASLTRNRDNTMSLTQNGRIAFDIPSDIAQQKLPPFLGEEYNLYWIRCRVVEGGYEIPPRIDTIKLNTISATQRQTVQNEPLTRKDESYQPIAINDEKISSGLPYQVFESKNDSILAGTQVVKVHEPDDASNGWEARDDFDASDPADNHYLLRATEGEIVFGDGVKGRIPPKCSTITLTYRFGGGEIGNIPDDTTWNPLQINGIPINVENERSASGGAEEEAIEATQARVRKDLKVPYRAVTAADYESIVKNTPDLRVARAHAVASPDDNLVTVTVVPHSTSDRPTPSQGFLDTVCRHVDRHRLVTTNLKIVPPEYVQVSVDAEVRIEPQNDSDAMKGKIETALSNFLNPLTGGPDGNGWPFGRSVYQSEIHAVIEAVNGVDCVTKLTLSASGSYQSQNGNIKILPLHLVYPGTHNIDIRVPDTICKP